MTLMDNVLMAWVNSPRGDFGTSEIEASWLCPSLTCPLHNSNIRIQGSSVPSTVGDRNTRSYSPLRPCELGLSPTPLPVWAMTECPMELAAVRATKLCKEGGHSPKIPRKLSASVRNTGILKERT